jgi:hypothetical protein
VGEHDREASQPELEMAREARTTKCTIFDFHRSRRRVRCVARNQCRRTWRDAYAQHTRVKALELCELVSQSYHDVASTGLSVLQDLRSCAPRVVSIVAVTQRGEDSGTGIVLNEQGLILIIDHVIEVRAASRWVTRAPLEAGEQRL